MHGENQLTYFFPVLLEEFHSAEFLENVRRKFHFEEEHTDEIRKVAEEMLPVMQKEAFWESMPAEWSDTVSLRQSAPEEENAAGSRRKAAGTKYERVVISLGAGLDRLQEQYSEQGSLSKSYMLEALAGELLMESYAAYNRYVAETTDWHVARYHFPGSEEAYPLEMLPELLAGLTKRVTCNAAFCLIPKKSVVFVAELTQDESVQCEGICMGCHKMHCTNRIEDDFQTRRRMVHYGYSRIFGK